MTRIELILQSHFTSPKGDKMKADYIKGGYQITKNGLFYGMIACQYPKSKQDLEKSLIEQNMLAKKKENKINENRLTRHQ